MGKLPIERTVDGVIAREPRELLRQHGFKRRGRNFHRARSDFVDSVWFQTMRGNPSAFCVNLTLIHPEHHCIWAGRPLPSSPSADNTVFLANTRVFFDTPDGEGHWWIIESSGQSASIARQVAERLDASLSYFDLWPSLDVLIRAIEKDDEERLSLRELDLPILLAARGDSQRALALLEELPPEKVFPDVVERLKGRG